MINQEKNITINVFCIGKAAVHVSNKKFNENSVFYPDFVASIMHKNIEILEKNK